MKIFCFDNSRESSKTISDSFENFSSVLFSFYDNEAIPNITQLIDTPAETIVFIDTRLHGRKQNSFSIAMSIREKFPLCHIVFMSSYPEDMSFCFKNLVRPSGFLLKPFSSLEAAKIISDVLQNIKKLRKAKTLYISTHEYKRSIETDKIIYFSTFGKKLFLKTADGERIEFYSTMSKLEAQFSEDFVRCHSGFLVNREYIKGFKKGEIELRGLSETLPVSKKYKPYMTDYLTKIPNS